MKPLFSDAYARWMLQGPFPGRIDPWAEDDHYFGQIHGGVIDHLLIQAREPLLRMGYYASKEVSLQIVAGREPDIAIQTALNAVEPPPRWDYETAAVEVLAEPGIDLITETTLFALHIRQSGNLITVVEVISAGNKDRPSVITDYQSRREGLVVQKGVQVVEIDLTRSNHRLITHPEAARYAYHVAVFLPGARARLIGMHYGEKLKRIALPLRSEVIPVELQEAYDYGYQMALIASQIENQGNYVEQKLHMPSMLTDRQKQQAQEAVERWRERLEQLKQA